MSILRRLLVGNVFVTILVTAGFSQAALVEWALLATGQTGLSLVGWVATALGLTAANAALIFLLRTLPWRIVPIYWFSRFYVMLSLGALVAGPALYAILLLGLPFRLGGAEQIARISFVAGGGLVALVAFGSILWGFVVGQRRLAIERVALPVRNLPEAFEGLQIVHLSDLHIGRQLRAPRLRQYVDRANGVGADLIVLTGDIFDFDPVFIEEGCRELSRLEARLGVYAILGNHDVYTGADAVAEGVRRLTSIRLLRDEWTWIEHGGEQMAILGIDDPGRGWTDRDSESAVIEHLAKEVPPGVPRILLAHRPSYFRQAARLGINVMLSGHTHGGQICPPAPLHHHNVSRLIAHWTRGLFGEGDTLLYVNRGLGVAGPPVRLNCPREIAVLSLVRRS
jgi:predicted MPP superfamily phosphohydrolase